MTSKSLGEIANEFQQQPGDGSVWEYILTQIAGLRGKALWDDVSDVMMEIAERGTVRQMRAGLEYLNIRYMFFEHLEATDRNLRHVNDYEMHKVQALFARITSRLGVAKAGRVTKRRTWVKEKIPKKVSYTWLN